MTVQRFYSGSVEPLGDREVGVIAATNQLARDGHVLEPSGINLANYNRNPIVLFNHDPSQPIGTATAVGLSGGSLAARITFAPAGVSTVADQACALVKAGIMNGVSIGFDPTDTEPLDPARPRGGQHILKSELYEISIVAIPADTGASVVARSFDGLADRVAFFNSLPPLPRASIERAAALLPRAAGAPILSHAGHVWTLQQIEREKERRYSYEARQAELRRLQNPWG